jgi:hypothetical protein
MKYIGICKTGEIWIGLVGHRNTMLPLGELGAENTRFLYYFFFGDSLCYSPGWPKTHSLPASVSQGDYRWVPQHLAVTFFFFLAVLVFELRALCLPGRHSTAWATPPSSPFTRVIFKVSLLTQANLHYNPPILCFRLYLGGQVYTTTRSFFPIKIGISWLFFCLGWPGTTVFPISASPVVWGDRHTTLHPAVSWDGASWSVCLDWPLKHSPPVSASQFARIAGVSH